jgi:hypothetical protein
MISCTPDVLRNSCLFSLSEYQEEIPFVNAAPIDQGSILQNSFSAEKFSDKVSSLDCIQISTQMQHRHINVGF